MLGVLRAVVGGAAAGWVAGWGVVDVVVDSLTLVTLVADDGGALWDVLVCDVAGGGVDDAVERATADVGVLGCVIGCSGIRVRVAPVVGGSKPGTVTCAVPGCPAQRCGPGGRGG